MGQIQTRLQRPSVIGRVAAKPPRTRKAEAWRDWGSRGDASQHLKQLWHVLVHYGSRFCANDSRLTNDAVDASKVRFGSSRRSRLRHESAVARQAVVEARRCAGHRSAFELAKAQTLIDELRTAVGGKVIELPAQRVNRRRARYNK